MACGKFPARLPVVGSGTSLIQELRVNNIAFIPITPEGDKITRCAAISAQFEACSVFFPKSASWLDDLKAELLGFPNVKHDDQVDSVTQALSWIARHRRIKTRCVLPIIVTTPRRYFGDAPDYWWAGP
jgi:phage terminase large subunit-like protein